MKSIFLVMLVVVLVAENSGSILKGPVNRANLNVGNVTTGNRLLHRQYIYRQPVPNTVQSEDLVYRGNATARITAVQATEVGYTQYANAWILAGGVGQSNVTIRVQSSRGYGYYYLVDIWGR